MNGLMRASLATITVVGIAGVALRVSGYGERLSTAIERWEEGHQHWFFEGAVGRVIARYYTPLSSWLWAAYAKGIELQPEDEVLDVACGSGFFLAKHATHVRRIAGLDQSREMIDQARVTNRERVAEGTAEFVVGDVTALPWEDDSFTVVTSNDMGCYVSKAPAAISEMYRVLKPDGRAVVGDDRCGMLEAAGFRRVSGRHVLGMYLTTGYKD